MSGLRIIGGKARGKRLRSVPGDTTRPITDRTKESLFNIIGSDIQGAFVLDLFAGTGSVGIEALSRGAGYVRFIDKASEAIKTIHANLVSSGFSPPDPGSQFQVLRMDAFTHLEMKSDSTFDYVYIAPPQYKDLWKKALTKLDERVDWLNEDAWVIVQIHPVEFEPITLTHLDEFDRRTYGSTLLIFYQVK